MNIFLSEGEAKMSDALDDTAWAQLLQEEREIVEWVAWVENDLRLKCAAYAGAVEATGSARALRGQANEILIRIRGRVDAEAQARAAVDPELGSGFARTISDKEEQKC